MQALAQWWRRWVRGSVRHAWGMAPQAEAWALVGLARQNPHLAQVHTLASLQAPMGQDAADPSWLSPHLRQNGRASGRSHRLNMALPAAQLQEGHIDFPADFPPEDWPYEVQLEVSQALQLPPDEVNFDFEPAPSTGGLVQRVHWIGCAQALMTDFKSCTRAAGWRLAAVESETQAARRGLRALQGGVASLLTQPSQDWQFRLNHLGGSALPLQEADAPVDSQEAIEDALRQVLTTPAGPRLVASGLALRAWQ
jgi:hypothetical protein